MKINDLRESLVVFQSAPLWANSVQSPGTDPAASLGEGGGSAKTLLPQKEHKEHKRKESSFFVPFGGPLCRAIIWF
jgi:hypothetical protein